MRNFGRILAKTVPDNVEMGSSTAHDDGKGSITRLNG